MQLICEGACNDHRWAVERRVALWREQEGRPNGAPKMPRLPPDLAAALKTLTYTEHIARHALFYECHRCGALRRWGRTNT